MVSRSSVDCRIGERKGNEMQVTQQKLLLHDVVVAACCVTTVEFPAEMHASDDD